jgi:hypothetical protein
VLLTELLVLELVLLTELLALELVLLTELLVLELVLLTELLVLEPASITPPPPHAVRSAMRPLTRKPSRTLFIFAQA